MSQSTTLKSLVLIYEVVSQAFYFGLRFPFSVIVSDSDLSIARVRGSAALDWQEERAARAHPQTGNPELRVCFSLLPDCMATERRHL